MAEVDPGNTDSGNNQSISTGSILSQDSRNSMLSRTQVVSIVQSEVGKVQAKQTQVDNQNAALIEQQQNSFLGFNSSILSIKDDIERLGSSLNGISSLLQQDSFDEQTRIRTQQEKDRLLAEQEVRIGKENEIEEKIQNAVVEPVEKIAPKLSETFGNITSALGFLFAGWLTAQLVSSAKDSDNIIKLFDGIKNSVIGTLDNIRGGLTAIGEGFKSFKDTISNITQGIQSVLSGAGFASFISMIPGLAGLLGMDQSQQDQSQSSGTPSGSNQQTSNPVGKFVGFLSNLLSTKGKDGVDSVLSSLTEAMKGNNPLGEISKITGITLNASDIAEALNKNIFGDTSKDKQINDISQTFAAQTSPTTTTTVTAPPATPTTPTPTTSQPQQTMTGQPTASTAPPLSPERISQFEKAWNFRNFPGAKGQIKSYWDKLSLEEQKQAKQWADSKGYNWAELGLPDPMMGAPAPAPGAPVGPPMAPQPSPLEVTPPAPPAPAQVTPMPTAPAPSQQAPAQTPNVTVVPLPQTQAPQNVPITDGPLTDVPLINSANPDNFYVLYSQLHYNVVT